MASDMQLLNQAEFSKFDVAQSRARFLGWARSFFWTGFHQKFCLVSAMARIVFRLTRRNCGQLARSHVAHDDPLSEAIMTASTYPSPDLAHRRADLAVHIIGLVLILTAGGLLIAKSVYSLENKLIFAVVLYVLCALVSNVASSAYHFSPWHGRRQLLRRIDHAAIYLSISGTFTPFLVQAGTAWTLTLLWVSWGLTALAIWNKITNETVKSRWSTASYLGLGAVGLCALPDLTTVPVETLWCIIGGAACYVIGTAFYVRKTMPFRYAAWHTWVSFGGILMFAGVWMAMF
ncbi:MAG: hemolysin III [Paracoccaceae bacterium]|jgi:hemolysin III